MNTRNFNRARALAAALLVCSTSAPLAAQGLTGYNVFTFGSFSQANTEVNGRLAVGGSLSSANASVGTTLPNGFSGPSLVVGGAANWTNGQIFHGDVYVAGARTFSNYAIPGGTLKPQATPLPVDFVAEKTRLDNLSNSYSSLAVNGITTSLGNQLFFQGTSAGANVFTVTQAQLAAASGGYKFYAPTNGSIIVNVLGVTGGQFFANTGFDFCSAVVNPTSFSGCSQGSNNTPPDLVSRLLWNVNTAAFTGVSFSGSMRGSFLGTNVGITATYGSCIGDFVAATINSNCEFYDDAYNGYVTTTSVVPEPASFALMVAGLASVGVAVRRRKVRAV